MSTLVVGVLALQGAYTHHGEALSRLGVSWKPVLGPRDLEGLGALILPGGESTAISKLILKAGLVEPLSLEISHGIPVLGTCAGMILLADTVLDSRPDQISFHAIDLTVKRNGYGRQVDSFETDIDVIGIGGGSVPAVFIRAPVVEKVGDRVDVLATLEPDAQPVVCRQDAVLVTSFHPELTGDCRLHELFVETARSA